MRSVTPQLTEELSAHVNGTSVAKAEAYPVSTFRELMEQVAKLAYANKDSLLFFRGQERDYVNKAGSSTLYPGIYRGERLSRAQLELRFDVLSSAGKRLCDALSAERITGAADVRRRRYIQWSILQHYEVCPTPLLDMTHNARVACSFAFLSSETGDPYVFVLALPYITNRISLNSEHDLAIVRLLSICPPEALRPYYQDGYMAGTDSELSDYESKDELDFNRVLIAKFRLKRGPKFWGSGFSELPRTALYPRNDRVEKICIALRSELGTEVEPGRLGQFLQAWTDVENTIMSMARSRSERVFSIREALDVLRRTSALPVHIIREIDTLRTTRNQIVHRPKEMTAEALIQARTKLEQLQQQLSDKL